MTSPRELALQLKARLLDKKGENIAILDMHGVSNLTDFFVIVTANSTPHIRALVDEAAALADCRQDGRPETGWVVLDYLDVIVHVFSPTLRTYYSLEELWRDAPRIT